MVLRVHEILESLDTPSKMQLKKLLPKGLKMPEVETVRVPSAALFGAVAEEMLRLPSDQINADTLLEVASCHTEEPLKSKTAQTFVELLKETRIKLEGVKRGDLEYNRAVSYDCVEGHPDAATSTQVFEVKVAAILKQGWIYFLMQAFAYAALDLSVQDVYLVLPLQKYIWHYSIATNGWSGRKAYREFLNEMAKKAEQNSMNDRLVGTLLREKFFIGFHASKQKTLPDTIQSFPDYRKPYQIFLGGPQNSSLTIEDGELTAAATLVQQNRISLYVHSQYMINLCTGENDWNTKLLMKNLQYASAIGCKGVVVHVGKSTTRPLSEALANMKTNIQKALEAATRDCPLLLETPAGQGTETLKDQKEFIDFVLEINDPRLRVCLDTCHVFACGHKPLEYIQSLTEHSNLLRLVHYNDSATPCGSCVDRHAFMGTGHIGMDGMKAIAELCGSKNLPMVIE